MEIAEANLDAVTEVSLLEELLGVRGPDHVGGRLGVLGS